MFDHSLFEAGTAAAGEMMMLRQEQAFSGYGADLQVIRGLAYAFPVSGLLWTILALFALLLYS